MIRPIPPKGRAYYFGGIGRAAVKIGAPALSPNDRRVGRRIVTFRACSGLIHTAARRVARPPKRAVCEAPARRLLERTAR